ncbi:PP2C family protein-serine/threonine phosphatase [Mycolicibacterium sp. P1-5]|uniref:PP2C family protein-serine/threonine phosphatase n=1 Tax=Mycolicibacterium sp. P1-5 TaxID=2024617 RepID=UPI0011EBC9F5|nr:SpoIIE family protein phosphatase [Mycolicibacterium sp. P1-5]KAA0110628.1 PAS domain S-box protein [Mycolicibacterium sp. P1-5]
MTDVADLWENGPSGQLAATPDGQILRANTTLATWLGTTPNALRGKQIADLLTVGGRIHFETHFAPLLAMSGQLDEISVELRASDGSRRSVFLSANVQADDDGRPALLRVAIHDARERRSYERAILGERQRAESAQARAESLTSILRRSLLPPSLSVPEGLAAATHYQPSMTDIGGDFYDLFPLSHNTSGFFLGDVCGKGPEAAAITSLTRYTLRTAAVIDRDPTTVLHRLNDVLNQEFRGGQPRFCTVVFGTLTPRRGGFAVRLASGGHPPPLLLEHSGDVSYLDITGGMAVGLTDQPKFVDAKLWLAPGDTMLLYSDGLTEARVGEGTHRYDDDGELRRFVGAMAPAGPDAVIAEIRQLLGSFGSGVEDDTAVLALGVP